MNEVEKLFTISQKKEKLIIGLMSGTSLDGLDIALCKIKGVGKQTQISVEKFETIPFPSHLSDSIRNISKANINLEDLCLWNAKLGRTFGEMVNDSLKEWNIKNENIDLIASHGQTVFHSPFIKHKKEEFDNATLQIGDGDHISTVTGIITISDFRQKHVAAGGQGAPLAAYGDYILFAEENENVVLLNIGGIANITFIPKGKNIKIICTDIGPGNTLMDAWMRNIKDKPFDENAFMASRGNVNEELLSILKDNSFFNIPSPKTTGSELFNLEYIKQALEKGSYKNISDEDVMATLSRLTSDIIVEYISALSKDLKVYVSGGGIHNPLLMKNIKAGLGSSSFHKTEEKNILSDAKEAVLFAVLANECVSGTTSTFAGIDIPKIKMGKISFP